MTTSTSLSSGDLSIVKADGISKELFDLFSENCFTEILIKKSSLYKTQEYRIGTALTNAMTIYLDIPKKKKKKTNIKRSKLQDIMTPIQIIVKGVNPKIHQKFIKYIKKIYKPQDFNWGYNLELNIVIGTYACHLQIPLLMYSETILNINKKAINPPPSIKTAEFITYDIFKEEFHVTCQDYGLNNKEEKKTYEACQLLL